jgi:DNA-binding beta-propeller fold protein YncE
VTSWGMINFKDKDYEMKSPLEIYIDNCGFIYIVDSGKHRIFKFDESGNFLIEWGDYGTGRGLLNEPSALNIDSKGNVFVVDKGNNRVQQFKIPSQ